jgi:hypothetical protein
VHREAWRGGVLLREMRVAGDPTAIGLSNLRHVHEGRARLLPSTLMSGSEVSNQEHVS